MGRQTARDEDRRQPAAVPVNMEAGHGGKSGRFERIRQNAEWQAFMLSQLGVAGE
jgi:oligopeptidase B